MGTGVILPGRKWRILRGRESFSRAENESRPLVWPPSASPWPGRASGCGGRRPPGRSARTAVSGCRPGRASTARPYPAGADHPQDEVRGDRLGLLAGSRDGRVARPELIAQPGRPARLPRRAQSARRDRRTLRARLMQYTPTPNRTTWREEGSGTLTPEIEVLEEVTGRLK